MILLDASIFIEYLRGRDPKLADSFRRLNLGVCGVTRAEVLHGARNDADRARLTKVLDRFKPVPIPDSRWDTVGLRLNQLRKSGLSVPFADVVVATVAIDLGAELWGVDAHFSLMANVLPLKLYRPVP